MFSVRSPVRIIALAFGLAYGTASALATTPAAATATTAAKRVTGRRIARSSPTRLHRGAPERRRVPTHARGGRPGRKLAAVERRVAPTRSGLPNVQALGALVLDENGRELYARNPDAERPIASISKLAATLTVMDHGLELEGLSTITKVDIEVARGGARSRLLEGTTLSNRDLLHAALMGSDNRAIPALGRAVRLSPSMLAIAMTAKAKELGLTHTRFHDPTGLSVENVSTPRETIAMLKAVMRNPILGPITRRVEYEAHPVGRPPILYVNTYRPAIRGNLEVLGGKTGYNDDARYCLVLAAKVEGKTCFMAFLANEGKMTRFGDVARVADWIIARRPQTPAPPAVLAAAPAASSASSSSTPVSSPPATPLAAPTAEEVGGSLPPAATDVAEPTEDLESTPTPTPTPTRRSALPVVGAAASADSLQ